MTVLGSHLLNKDRTRLRCMRTSASPVRNQTNFPKDRRQERLIYIQFRELRPDASIRSGATKKMDSRALAIVSRDLVAAEGHYHRSCYQSYTGEEKAASHVTNEKDENEAQHEAVPLYRDELFAKPQVIAMANVSSRMVVSMNSVGIVQVKDSTKKHIRR